MNIENAKIDALWLLARLWQEFEGLRDGESEVDGAELVAELSCQISECDCLRQWLIENAQQGVQDAMGEHKMNMTHEQINHDASHGIIDEREARARHSLLVAQEEVDRIRRCPGSNPFRVRYGPEIQADIDAGITGYKFS